MTMDSGLHRIELTGPAGLARLVWFPGLAGIPGLGDFSGPAGSAPAKTFTLRFVGVLAALVVGLGAWVLLSNPGGDTAVDEPLAAAAISEPVRSPTNGNVPEGAASSPAAGPAEPVPLEAAPVQGLRISSQSWRRGGLGSRALVTLTLRNGNDYAVKEIEIFCSFARRDGSHLTDRRRMIHETVNMKSRKTFTRMHVGFVNINANRAKCSAGDGEPRLVPVHE